MMQKHCVLSDYLSDGIFENCLFFQTDNDCLVVIAASIFVFRQHDTVFA